MKITDKEREILEALAVEHLSQREAAEKLGLKLRTLALRLEEMRIAGGYPNTRELKADYLKTQKLAS